MLRAAVCLALLALGATRAAADERSTARVLYDRGTYLFNAKQYREAAAQYEEAYRLMQDPNLLFDLGQTYRLAGDYARALRAYRNFLRQLPDAPNRAEVGQRIVETLKLLHRQPQPKIKVLPPPDVQARLDANRAPLAPPAEALGAESVVLLPPAEHAVPLRAPVYKRWWLWTLVGGVVVAGAAVGIGLALTTPKNAPYPADGFTVRFP